MGLGGVHGVLHIHIIAIINHEVYTMFACWMSFTLNQEQCVCSVSMLTSQKQLTSQIVMEYCLLQLCMIVSELPSALVFPDG